jgi:hypothetical protein
MVSDVIEELQIMTQDPTSAIQRRDFLKIAGAVTVSSLAPAALAAPGSRISILVDAGDPVASAGPVKRAAAQLRKALAAKGATCEMIQSADQAKGASLCVLAAGSSSQLASGFPKAGAEITSPEGLRMAPGTLSGAPAILVSAIDQRGYIYGLMELAERVAFNDDPSAALHLSETIEEKPANEIRCVSRYFCSEMEDKSWYYDKDFWRGYLDTLVASRFNRFTMAYGLEYDFPRGVTDDYIHLPYPYLFDVPGYEGVHVLQLASPDGKVLPAPVKLSQEEKAKNFEMLRFIAAETGARGLHFQLGIWTHAYKWTDSPKAYHSIEGLTPETHAPYCRDALAIILKSCPEIQGLTMRVHGESGIPEGSYPFWKTLFEAIANCGRTVEVDMHAKGVNQTMIDIAVATGMPVKLGAKYSAEHESLGYNQADIRALEIPKPGREESALFSLSSGSRLFTRYGYGDFFQQGSKAQIVYRLWPGTQHHLLSADPEMAAGYSHTSHFCGAAGMDLMEPLTFKGREGSGNPGGRCAYADTSLNPKYDWKKFEYYYRVWGRRLYNPEADPETWRRYLRSIYGPGANSVEAAVSNASRVLPLITSAHLASASNHAFWPEIYANMPIVLGSEKSPYYDSPEPRVFGTVSPLDPQIFSTIVEYSKDLLDGKPSGKYSPVEVAQWLEDFTAASDQALAAARSSATSKTSPEFRRMEEDVLIQIGLGRFFAAKLRSGVLYEIYQQTGSAEAGKQALAKYQEARDVWAKMASRASGVYMADVSYGDVPGRRGHWSDRTAGIDTDIAAMQSKLQSPSASSGSAESAEKAIRVAMGKPSRPSIHCRHTPPSAFHAGQPLALSLVVPAGSSAPASVRLCYRHVNQAERWLSMEMERKSEGYSAAIPAGYTDSPYPLQYYFELRGGADSAWLYPGFNSTLSNQPYYAIAKRSV